ASIQATNSIEANMQIAIPALAQKSTSTEKTEIDATIQSAARAPLSVQSLATTTSNLSVDPTTVSIPLIQTIGQIPMKAFTSWREGKTQYRMWINGSYHFISEAPYVEVDGVDDLIVIEEKRRNKTYRGMITKAPYDGAIIQSYIGKMPNSWSGNWKKGEALHLWTVNGKWKMLSDRERNEWMYKIMREATGRLEKMQRQTALFPPDEDWPSVIATQRQFKEMRFVSHEDITGFHSWGLHHGHEPGTMASAPALSSFPYQATSFLRSSNKGLKKKGFRKATKTTTGGSDYSAGGARYGMVIENFPTSRLIDFNFHLRYNDFEKVDFELSLYRVGKASEILYRITETPIAFSISNGKNWVSTDLSSYDLAVDGDVLAILEMKRGHNKRKDGGIFFSHSWGTFLNFQNGSALKDWDFYEDHFAWYFTIEEGTIDIDATR
ncbi:MAG: hypothetical protein AAFO94_08505, partial [Bacteroidota bacterium]